MRDSLRILEYLRGLVQKNPKSFSFIIAGLTRRFASQSMIGRKQNPLFNFVVDFPLGGPRQDELRTLSWAADGQGWRLVMKSFGAWLLANYPGTQVASLTG